MEALDKFNQLLNLCALTLSILVSTFVFVKLRFKLDGAAYVIVFAYILVMIARLISDIPAVKEGAKYLAVALWPVASNLVWGVLYYFIYEMKSVFNKLSSQSPKEHNLKESKLRKERCLVAVISLLYMTPSVGTYILTSLFRRIYLDNFALCLSIMIACRLTKLGLDVYVSLQFLSLMRYFINKKEESLMQQEG
jgi:hypothetical protein